MPDHEHAGHGGPGHVHGGLDHDVATHARAVRAVWVSTVALGATALLQLFVVAASGSAALFADSLHNLSDAAGTAVLLIALRASRRPASISFTYGWRRAEDVAAAVIVLLIAVSAILAGVDSVAALLAPDHAVRAVGWVFAAAVVGVIGNEGVAQYKIRVGRGIDSLALIADGRHARTDGLASAGAAVGAVGAWLGHPIVDALAGLAITAVIAWVLATTGRDVLRRWLDWVDPATVATIERVARVDGVTAVTNVRARHAGRSLLVQLCISVDGDLTVRRAHGIGEAARHAIVHTLPAVIMADVHIDPAGEHDAAHGDTSHHFR